MRNSRNNAHQQKGVSLPETLIAALLFAVSLLGLLQYHQVLLQSFQRQSQYRQAWSLAHYQLEAFSFNANTGTNELMFPHHWQREVKWTVEDASCRKVTVKIQTPLRQQIELNRWYCARQ